MGISRSYVFWAVTSDLECDLILIISGIEEVNSNGAKRGNCSIKEKKKEKSERRKKIEWFEVSKSYYEPKRALLKKSTFLNSTLSSILECALILFKIVYMSRSRIISLQ